MCTSDGMMSLRGASCLLYICAILLGLYDLDTIGISSSWKKLHLSKNWNPIFFVMSDSSTMLKSPAQTLWSLLSEEDTLSIGNDGFPPLTSHESLVLHSSKQASCGVKHLTFQTNKRWKDNLRKYLTFISTVFNI